jgi:hypothetical protein
VHSALKLPRLALLNEYQLILANAPSRAAVASDGVLRESEQLAFLRWSLFIRRILTDNADSIEVDDLDAGLRFNAQEGLDAVRPRRPDMHVPPDSLRQYIRLKRHLRKEKSLGRNRVENPAADFRNSPEAINEIPQLTNR